MPGFGIRGGDIDKQGVIWASLASGHLGSFDRRKCKGPLNGPKATGDHCPEGWSFLQYPGPGFKGSVRTARSRATTPGSTSTTPSGSAMTCRCPPQICNDGLIAMKDGKMISCACRILWAFTPKASTGASTIQKPAGKGRGLWTTSGDRAPWLMEGGKGAKPMAVHFQLRPDPLAK